MCIVFRVGVLTRSTVLIPRIKRGHFDIFPMNSEDVCKVKDSFPGCQKGFGR